MPTPNPRMLLREALSAFVQADEAELHNVVPVRTVARGRDLADAAAGLLDWMDDNAVDPGDPPSCSCGGRHWTCPGPGDACDGCDETEGLTPYGNGLLCRDCLAEEAAAFDEANPRDREDGEGIHVPSYSE